MSELSREEAALACALHAMGWHQHYTNCVEQAKLTIRNAPESIRSALTGPAGTKDEEWLAAFEEWKRHWRGAKTGTALAGGGGAGKAETYWHGRFREEERDRLALKDRCASLESRLAAAEKRAEEAEASAQAHIGHYERTVGERNDAVRKIDALKAELAEAKNAVKTEYHRGYDDYRRDLDAALARVKELEAKLATIRDAAGAQP